MVAFSGMKHKFETILDKIRGLALNLVLCFATVLQSTLYM